jgi:hypothetical protein
MGPGSKAAIITAETGIARVKWRGRFWAVFERRFESPGGDTRKSDSSVRTSAWVAYEIPLAPFERFVNRKEMFSRQSDDQIWLGEPLFIGAAFELDHGGEGIHAVRKAARQGIFRNRVDEPQKGSQPGFDENDAAFFSEHTLHFRKCFLEIFGKRGEMVQASLDNQDVLAASGEGKMAAVGDEAFCGAAILRDQAGGKIHSFEVRKLKALERIQTIAAAAKQFHNLGIAGPLGSTEFLEARDKFLNFLLRRFETKVGSFPGIGGGRDRGILV